MPIEIAKVNMYVASGPPGGSILIAKTNMSIVDDGVPAGPTAEVRVSEASIQLMGVSPFGVGMRVGKASVNVVFDFVSEAQRVSSVSAAVAVEKATVFQASQASYQVVCLGRVAVPRILAWPATLDGHDYYFLQLPDLTLVYDFHSGQWYNWGSGGRELWRAQIGIDWNAKLENITGPLGQAAGATSVVVGDYVSGALYFLDTNMSEDEDYEQPGSTIPFQRLAYGQMAMRGINYVPCNGVQIAGSIGESSRASDMTVRLSYSDDQGHSYVACDPIEMANGYYERNLHWRSLGSFRGPGRLFRIEDWGALVRIDGMDMDDGQ